MAEPLRYNAGIVTAYGAAVRGGYTGTYEEFCEQQAGYAQSAAAVEQAKRDAEAAARAAEAAVGSYNAMTAAATGLPAGSNPTAEMDHTGEHPVLRLGIAPGADGYSPTVTVTSITGGHRVTITDEQGDHSFDVMDGEDGQPGDDGYSPTVAVTTITGGHRITITDAQGDHSFDVMDGQDGDDGYSPTVTVTDITGGHRVTITDAQGDHTFDVMNGLDGTGAVDSVNGKTGPVVLDGRDINVNNSAQTPETIEEALGDVNRALTDKYEKPATGIPASDLADGVIPDVPVQDVQVDGTSVVDGQGLADIPLGELADRKADVIIASASGAIASFADGADDMPLRDCVVNIEPVQDLHGYDNPWPAGGGKNLAKLIEDGTVPSISNGRLVPANGCRTDYIKITPNGSYTFSYSGTGISTIYWMAYASDKTFKRYGLFTGNPQTIVFGSEDEYVMLRTTEGLSAFTWIQFELGSTATAYAPYSNICPITGWTGANVTISPTLDAEDGTTYPISWQTEAGTVYGGTLDVTTGTLTVDRAIVDLGTFTWTKHTSNNFYAEAVLQGMIDNGYGKCTQYKHAQDVGGVAYLTTDMAFAFQNLIGSNTRRIIIRDTTKAEYTNVQFEAAMSGVQLVYELAEPQTYHLTPTEIRTLLGQNNIWADTGDVAVEYPADTKAYVDEAVSVTDVQVNGSSILQDGVANVPIASQNNLGAVKTASTNGTQMLSDGVIATQLATDDQIKLGSQNYRVIVPGNQYKSAFYGLAKAAGDTTQSASSNAVGTYTESAKSAISQMLNAPEIVSGTTPSIPAKAGVTYKCGEVSTLSITLPSSGDVEVIFDSGSTPTALTFTLPTGVTALSWANGFDPTSLDANTRYDLIITDGEWGLAAAWAV